MFSQMKNLGTLSYCAPFYSPKKFFHHLCRQKIGLLLFPRWPIKKVRLQGWLPSNYFIIVSFFSFSHFFIIASYSAWLFYDDRFADRSNLFVTKIRDVELCPKKNHCHMVFEDSNFFLASDVHAKVFLGKNIQPWANLARKLQCKFLHYAVLYQFKKLKMVTWLTW